jgi:hypothetical protein
MQSSQKKFRPVASKLYALCGTRAAEVLYRIDETIANARRLDKLKEGLDVQICYVDKLDDAREGLVLVDCEDYGVAKTYSMRTEYDAQKNQYRIKVGSKLPDQRIQQVANEVMAMLERGVRTWTDGKRVTESPYGMVAAPSRENTRKRKKRQRNRSGYCYANE